jgi:hypothetical protein
MGTWGADFWFLDAEDRMTSSFASSKRLATLSEILESLRLPNTSMLRRQDWTGLGLLLVVAGVGLVCLRGQTASGQPCQQRRH